MRYEPTLPKPGSDAAVAKGCTCPRMDNRNGEGIGDGMFWLSPTCPMHSKPIEEDDENCDD